MKYKLLKKETNGLHRIKALKSFGNVFKGETGGFIKSKNNLSQDGNAWVFGNAMVFENARVSGNAEVSGDARMFGNAKVFGNAWVSGNVRMFGDAKVFGNAKVFENVRMFGDVKVSGNAWVSGDAKVYGNARVSGNAKVSGNTMVSGNAMVFGDASVSGDAKVFGDVKVFEAIHLLTGHTTDTEFTTLLKNSCYAAVFKNKVVLYKKVFKLKEGIYQSCYDKDFLYGDGKISKVENCDESPVACSNGLHCSHPTYWNEGDTLISVEVRLKDIITIQEGKVRCRKLKVLGECKS